MIMLSCPGLRAARCCCRGAAFPPSRLFRSKRFLCVQTLCAAVSLQVCAAQKISPAAQKISPADLPRSTKGGGTRGVGLVKIGVRVVASTASLDECHRGADHDYDM